MGCVVICFFLIFVIGDFVRFGKVDCFFVIKNEGGDRMMERSMSVGLVIGLGVG